MRFAMIFVAVGTQKFPMNRLLAEIDRLVAEGFLTEPVFAQTGCSDYVPEHLESEPFLSKETFEEKLDACDLLITHSGVATIMGAVKRRKPVIVMPRQARYGEHVDDHQMQIAEDFSDKNLTLLALEADELRERIEQARCHQFAAYTSHGTEMVETIRMFIDSV